MHSQSASLQATLAEMYSICSTSLHPPQNSNGILFQKLFWPTVRKICFSDRKQLLKFKAEAEGQEFAKVLRSQEQFVQTVKGQSNFW